VLFLASVQRWNETYLHFHKTDPKQTYYLSMEYLQGRALTNAVGNLGITGAYAEAVKKFGYELEALVAEVSSLRVSRVICLMKVILI
jgi:glycogen phosphorylase